MSCNFEFLSEKNTWIGQKSGPLFSSCFNVIATIFLLQKRHLDMTSLVGNKSALGWNFEYLWLTLNFTSSGAEFSLFPSRVLIEEETQATREVHFVLILITVSIQDVPDLGQDDRLRGETSVKDSPAGNTPIFTLKNIANLSSQFAIFLLNTWLPVK